MSSITAVDGARVINVDKSEASSELLTKISPRRRYVYKTGLQSSG